MPHDNAAERFPIVTPEGEVIGSASRGECHSGSMLLHPVVHLHLFNPQGELYLQRRPDWKDIQPGRWDTAVGGHVDLGETVEEALRREAREELGIEGFAAQLLTRYLFRSEREQELVHVFRTVWEGAVQPSGELAGGRFWRMEEIAAARGRSLFTPNFEQESAMLFPETRQ